jgi:hypothetical protein
MAHSRAKKNVMIDTQKKPKNWIQSAINPETKGALHKVLGVSEGKKIPEKKLEKATHSRDPLTRKRAGLAETLSGFKHK